MANSGVLATVTFDSVSIAATSIQASITRNVLDATPVGQGYQTLQLGVMAMTASVTGFFDKSDYATITGNLKNSESAKTLTITWNTAETWTGSAFLTELSPSVDRDNLIMCSMTFSGTGSWVSGV